MAPHESQAHRDVASGKVPLTGRVRGVSIPATERANLILAAPLSGLIPVVFMGAVATIRAEPVSWTYSSIGSINGVSTTIRPHNVDVTLVYSSQAPP